METVTYFIFLGSKITADGDFSHEIKRRLLLEKKNYDHPRQHVKKQRLHFADKGLSSQSYGFSSSHVLMWELDHKEGWAPKNWCFQIPVVLKKTLESPLDYKEIKPVNHKENQPRIYIRKADAEAEAPIFFFFLICSEFCHTLKWNSRGFTCVPHPNPPSDLPLHSLPLGFPSVPGPRACLMHPTWAGDLFHPR